jgi:hypothetical protein
MTRKLIIDVKFPKDFEGDVIYGRYSVWGAMPVLMLISKDKFFFEPPGKRGLEKDYDIQAAGLYGHRIDDLVCSVLTSNVVSVEYSREALAMMHKIWGFDWDKFLGKDLSKEEKRQKYEIEQKRM